VGAAALPPAWLPWHGGPCAAAAGAAHRDGGELIKGDPWLACCAHTHRPLSPKSDVWSLGCLAYHMAALQPPFGGANPLAVARAVVEGRYEPLPEGPKCSERLRALVRAALQPDPDRWGRHGCTAAGGPCSSAQAADQNVACSKLVPAGAGPEQLTRTCACPACRRRPDIAGVAAMMTPQLLQALDALASWRQEQRRGPPAGCSAEEPAGNRLVLAPASQLQPVPDPTAQAGAACSTMR
jgi:hypothetical protein